MSEFFSLLKLCVTCGTVIFLAMLILLSLPQCKLRIVGLEMTKWAMVAGLVLLTISPLDVIPGLPIDDIGYIIGAIGAGRSAMGDRRQRKVLEEIDAARFEAKTREHSHV